MAGKSAKDREAELRIWESTPVYLTPEGHERLKAKLERLKKAIPALAQEAGRTAAYGDRSENAEYKEAKKQLRRTQGQIMFIEDQLRKIKIIPSGTGASGKIQMGSTVIVESKKGKMTFRIVGPQETNPGKGFISYLSPLGAALIGHAAGEMITFETGIGTQEYVILEIN